tara:strand:+ start:153 stop:1718 length:1566 start_codon:yes stop_codon:yes gene_type:complete
MLAKQEIVDNTLQANEISFEVQPFGWKYIEGLRSSNYRYTTSLAELTDNSDDVGAQLITINVERANGKISRIIHFDNGQGMNEEILVGSFTLGFDRDNRSASQLGKFGMGGTKSCLKLAKTKRVLTKTKKGNLLARKYNLDIVKEKDVWGTIPYTPSKEEVDMFNKYRKESKSGTLIILEELDGIKTDRLDNVVNNIIRHYSKSYCEKIASGNMKIIINSTTVKPLDPLCFYVGAAVLYDEPLEGTDVPVEDGKLSPKMRLRVVDIRGLDKKITGVLQYGQGGYIFRNDRLICSGVFSKKGSTVKIGPHYDDHLNHFRWAVYYTGDHDNIMGTNVAKTSIDPIQSIQTRITNIVNPLSMQIRKREKEAKKKPTVTDQEKDKSEVSAILDEMLPNNAFTFESSEEDNVDDQNIININIERSTQDLQILPLEEIRDEALSRFMKVIVKDNSISIKLNLDHRFVYKYWTNGTKETRNLLKVLIPALASSYLVTKDGEEKEEVIQDFEYTFSNLLRKSVSVSDRI